MTRRKAIVVAVVVGVVLALPVLVYVADIVVIRLLDAVGAY